MASAHVACLEPDVQFCSASVICPVTMVCAGEACVTPEQATACDGKIDGDACMADGIAGTCFANGCLPAGCGNNRIDQGEACDDGNTTFGDQCAADCKSTEQCGNGVVDTPVGEQCDEGPAGLSGDGCSSRCQAELLLWRDTVPPLPSSRVNFRVAWTGTQLLLVGGVPVGGSVPIADQWRREGVTWVKDTPRAALPARTRFGLAFDEGREEVVAFGGYAAGGSALGDTWVYAGGTWTQKLPATSPPARGDVRLSYDRNLDRVMMFGGAVDAGSSAAMLADTWLWDGSDWTLAVTGGGSGCNSNDSGGYPCARANGALVYSEQEDTTLLFGGRPLPGGNFTREWRFEGGTQSSAARWIEDDLQIGVPAASSTVAAPVGDQVLAISGTLCKIRRGRIWDSCLPSPIDSSSIELVREPAEATTYLVGPTGRTYPFVSEQVWRVDPLLPVGPQAAGFDPIRNVTVVTSDEAVTRGTWQWTGQSWHSSSAVPGGISRRGGALAFDRDRRELVHFGGSNTAQSSLYADLYVFDGTAYVERFTTNAPPARRDHGLAYDEARQELVMFGGDTSLGASEPVDDTWTLLGVEWIRRAPTRAPSGRKGHAMAYDPVHQHIVLFGGRALDDLSGETWLWDGTEWSLVSASADGPGPREDATLVYDPVLGALVLVGGSTPGGWLTDAWLWTGTGWELAQSITAPAGLLGLVGARDPLGGITMFANASQWRLRREASGVPAERCENPEDDADGDGYRGCADPDCWQRCSPLCPPGQGGCEGPRCGDEVCSAIEAGFCTADCP